MGETVFRAPLVVVVTLLAASQAAVALDAGAEVDAGCGSSRLGLYAEGHELSPGAGADCPPAPGPESGEIGFEAGGLPGVPEHEVGLTPPPLGANPVEAVATKAAPVVRNVQGVDLGHPPGICWGNQLGDGNGCEGDYGIQRDGLVGGPFDMWNCGWGDCFGSDDEERDEEYYWFGPGPTLRIVYGIAGTSLDFLGDFLWEQYSRIHPVAIKTSKLEPPRPIHLRTPHTELSTPGAVRLGARADAAPLSGLASTDHIRFTQEVHVHLDVPRIGEEKRQDGNAEGTIAAFVVQGNVGGAAAADGDASASGLGSPRHAIYALPLDAAGVDSRAALRSAAPTVELPELASSLGILPLAAALVVSLLGCLYHRIRPDRMLQSPMRTRILDAVKARPGTELGALARGLGVHRTTLRHHVRLLTLHRYLRVVETPSSLRLFPAASAAVEEEARRLDATAAPLAREIVARASSEPGITIRALARALGVDRASVRYHVGRLVAAGVLSDARARQGRRVYSARNTMARDSGAILP